MFSRSVQFGSVTPLKVFCNGFDVSGDPSDGPAAANVIANALISRKLHTGELGEDFQQMLQRRLAALDPDYKVGDTVFIMFRRLHEEVNTTVPAGTYLITGDTDKAMYQQLNKDYLQSFNAYYGQPAEVKMVRKQVHQENTAKLDKWMNERMQIHPIAFYTRTMCAEGLWTMPDDIQKEI